MEAIAGIFSCSYLLLDENELPQTKTRTAWVHQWVKERESEGLYNKLLRELRMGHPHLYRNFLRMKADDFDYLLDLTAPLIQKQDTPMRKSIPPGERLAVTLRVLGTGDSFTSLAKWLFEFKQHSSSIQSIKYRLSFRLIRIAPSLSENDRSSSAT